MPKLFDTHCHLIHKNYKKSPGKVIQAAQDAGVDLFLHIGTSLEENAKAIELAEKHENVFCGLGVTPDENVDLNLRDIENYLKQQLKGSKKVVGVGECGINVSGLKNIRDLKSQTELFEMQVKLAIEFNLPLIIHNRNGDGQVLAMVEKYAKQGLTGVCHCFVQDWDYAQKMLDFGFYLAFGGIITYESGKDILETVKKAPSNKILIETDSPYLAPGDLRRSVNEPKNIVITLQKIAEARQISYDEAAKMTYENGKRLFTLQ
jgi:TatD DNase family protein